METLTASTAPTLEASIAKFAARVAEGKATSEELAFMTKVASPEKASFYISRKDVSDAIGSSLSAGL